MRSGRSILNFLLDVYRRFAGDAGSFLAATISYYALFSIFPLLLLAISIAGYVLTYIGSEDILQYVTGVLPQISGVVETNIAAVAANRQSTGAIGLLVLLWTGTAVFDAIGFAMNKVWRVPVGRHFVVSKLLSLASVVAVIVLFILTTFVSAGYETFQNYWSAVFESSPPLAAIRIAALMGTLIVSFLALAVIYAVIPNRKLTIRDVWPGALTAAISWELAKRLFALYTSRVARFTAIYGSVGVIIGLLIWLYISGMVLVLGAEINAALKERELKTSI